MTQLLQQVWDAVEQMPKERQNFIASLILEELEDENLWQKKFADSQKELAKAAISVKAKIKQGKVIEKGFGEL